MFNLTNGFYLNADTCDNVHYLLDDKNSDKSILEDVKNTVNTQMNQVLVDCINRTKLILDTDKIDNKFEIYNITSDAGVFYFEHKAVSGNTVENGIIKTKVFKGKEYNGKYDGVCLHTDGMIDSFVYEDCTFKNSVFFEYNCRNIVFKNCVFDSLFISDSLFTNVEFINCKITGCLASKTVLDCVFNNTNVDDSYFVCGNLHYLFKSHNDGSNIEDICIIDSAITYDFDVFEHNYHKAIKNIYSYFNHYFISNLEPSPQKMKALCIDNAYHVNCVWEINTRDSFASDDVRFCDDYFYYYYDGCDKNHTKKFEFFSYITPVEFNIDNYNMRPITTINYKGYTTENIKIYGLNIMDYMDEVSRNLGNALSYYLYSKDKCFNKITMASFKAIKNLYK